MICTKCGAHLVDSAQFCHKCGSPVKDGKSTSAKSTSRSSENRNKAVKKKSSYREEKDWEEEDWEDDDWDDEDERVDVLTIMTAIVGCILLVVVAVLGYHLYQQYVSGGYEDEEQQYEFYEPEGQELEEQQSWEAIGEPVSDHYVAVIKNVNVRDNPSTTDSNVLKVAQEGEVYPYSGTSEDGEWIKILLDDNTVGYVFHEYVNVND